jgi:hypothetical protein
VVKTWLIGSVGEHFLQEKYQTQAQEFYSRYVSKSLGTTIPVHYPQILALLIMQ